MSNANTGRFLKVNSHVWVICLFECFVMSVSQRDPSMVAPSVYACANISTSFFRTCIFHLCTIVLAFSVLAFSYAPDIYNWLCDFRFFFDLFYFTWIFPDTCVPLFQSNYTINPSSQWAFFRLKSQRPNTLTAHNIRLSNLLISSCYCITNVGSFVSLLTTCKYLYLNYCSD